MASPSSKRRKLQHSESDDARDLAGLPRRSGKGVPTRKDNGELCDMRDGDLSVDEDVSSEAGSSKAEEEMTDSEKAAPGSNTSFANNVEQKKQPVKRPATESAESVYTAEVYRSNMFKLQVDELLDQIRPNYGKKEVESAMRALKEHIEQIPSRPPLPFYEAQKALKGEGITVPFPQPLPPADVKYKLQYDRPANINATGSYPLKIAIRTDDCAVIDMVVTMPRTIFQDKDYLNHRYFYKRAFYLACVAAGLRSSARNKYKLSFDLMHGNQLQPVLLVKPSGDGSSADFTKSKCWIRIILALPENAFPQTRLLPTSSCIRLHPHSDSSEDNDRLTSSPATPFYNATIQADASVTQYLKLLHVTTAKVETFRDACMLGRVWLKQRGFGSQLFRGGFGNFEWSIIVALLLQPTSGTGAFRLSSGYSSYQLFKATLQFIARHNLTKTPFLLSSNNVSNPKGDSTPLLFDGSRNLNILYKMTKWAYYQLQHEAKTTVDMLSDPIADHFESTFITKTNILEYRFDAFIEIPLYAIAPDTDNNEQHAALIDGCSKVYDLLQRALTDRVSLISFSIPTTSDWSVKATRPSLDKERNVLVSLAIDPSNAYRSVDHGPPAEDKKAAASFRQFWGEKAELRRFKDGSILESVVWPVSNNSSILEQIIRHVLDRHLNPQAGTKATFTSDPLAHLLPSGSVQGQSNLSAFSSRMNALAALEKDIRGLEGLPLQVRTISAADPLLRYSDVDMDVKHIPASMVLQFEGSAQWPDDLCAIQRTKIAFLLKLADLLDAHGNGESARLGLENPSHPDLNQGFLDIFVPPGFTFRLRIYHDREATLLGRQLKDKLLDSPSREAAAAALSIYKHDYIHVPAHTQMLQKLCTRFPALSPSIRMTKRWFAAHLLSPHFAPELIELLVVRTFLQHHPWPVPACATVGFLRTLMFISRWDWRHVPLIVDFSAGTSEPIGMSDNLQARTFTTEDVEQIQTRFEAWRRIDPAMNRVALFAATNLDSEGTTWTDKSKPEKVVAARMTALAKAATSSTRAQEEKLLAGVTGKQARVDAGIESTPDHLFAPELRDYDVVIHLSSKYSTKGKRKQTATFKNLQLQQGDMGAKELQNIGFDPVHLFTNDLKEIYGNTVIWFWDPHALNVICGLFNPTVAGQRAWKVKADWNSLPSTTNNAKSDGANLTDGNGTSIDVNKGAIYNEIRRLGGEMIRSIEIKA
ncbi:pre-rRNA processing protein-like protein Utp22 [Aaosphaeria arxii CBS 175.79]|uniref:U3 small nucleolar RNA-associated protein 22 n=1 Tax=Aaosphaeria arxii CBS 175.79 TaxID=1450172 RepID=A0A6A5XF76_9PLEO|nr:pre-rRNA processing protein-like protein Utp22 [Aaosphaeria arxii CBS 175.79]KAF2011778.1 pre-rRNA processing protein-like protein Utp22 [Aaosphaeria arxii CBS 175.79]